MKKKLIISLFLLLVIFFIIWSFYSEWESILVFPWKGKPLFLIVSSIAYTFQLLLMFIIWHRLVQFISGKIPWSLDANVYFLSAAARRIPTPLWYLGSRFTLYPAAIISPSSIAVCSALEVVLILLFGMVFLLFAIPFYQLISPLYTVLSMFLAFLLVVMFYKHPNFLIYFLNKIFDYLKKKRVEANITRMKLLEWLVFYFLVFLLNAVSMYFLITGVMEIDINFGAVLVTATIYLLLAYISMFLTAGFGLKELAISFFFYQWMPISIGIVIALLYRLLMTVTELIFIGIVKLVTVKQAISSSPQHKEF